MPNFQIVKIRASLLILLLCVAPHFVKAQIVYSPFVDSISSLADEASILLRIRQLTGDTTVTVNSQTQTINSRHFLSPGNTLAGEFIYEKFLEFGYETEMQLFNNQRGVNVIATKTGTRYPDKEYIICGHYDNMPSGENSPGADDNASGTVAVMEAARVLSNISTDYTIKFIAWDEEEIGLDGSFFYAQQASQAGDDILGVLNLDMIAWDSDNNMRYSIATELNSAAFSNDFIKTTGYYQPSLTHNFINTTSSDHAAFWEYNYPAMLAIEDFGDFNQFYHTPDDDIPVINMPLFVALVRASIANIAANALNQRISFTHTPVASATSTQPREAIIIVNTDHPVAASANAPRLYYSSDSSNFNFVNPSQVENNTYKFMIPGFPTGSRVHYYFAVQDSIATMIATHPAGGRGITPPGTIAPQDFFSYLVEVGIGIDEIASNSNSLHQNYPNPARSVTNIKFSLTKPTSVALVMYDLCGQKIRTITSGRFSAGNHLIETIVSDLKTGPYYYTLESDQFSESKMMVIVN